MDQTIKIWDLKKQGYEQDPVVIYDHDDEIVCADIRKSDGLLATMDLQGTILIRSLNEEDSDPEQTLHHITDIPKGPDDYARFILNQELGGSSNQVILLLNDQIIIFDLQGR